MKTTQTGGLHFKLRTKNELEGLNVKLRKKRPPIPPPPLSGGDEDHGMPPAHEDEPQMPMITLPMYDMDDPVYRVRHETAQQLALQTEVEGMVLLKNDGALPLKKGTRVNVFGRHAADFFNPELCEKYGIELNRELYDYCVHYKNPDAGYTGSGWDEAAESYVRQSRTATGMFGMVGYLTHEPFVGHDVYNKDNSIRVKQMDSGLLARAVEFSNTAIVVIHREGGEGADHEKGDERLSEGEAGMLSWCTAAFDKVIVVLACNSVIDGDFLVEDVDYKFYMYTYGGGIYSNNVGNEILADYENRVELKYVDNDGNPDPHCYHISAANIQGAFYVSDKPGDRGAEALAQLLVGDETPSGRLVDEIVFDYDDDPVSLSFGGLTFSGDSIGDDRYIYGHNYVAYKEGGYLGYKYFETFCPERVVYPFGYGLSYTTFQWKPSVLKTSVNEYGELRFSVEVQVVNTGLFLGREVVELYVMAPYCESGAYNLEKPLVSLCAFSKTSLLQPGGAETIVLHWNARDMANYSDVVEHYVLEKGIYHFCIAGDARRAHSGDATVLKWELSGDMHFTCDEITGTPYRNLFTGSQEYGWRYDAKGTVKENIVYIHRTDVDGHPRVAPGTMPESGVVNEHTRETTQVLDLEIRGLSSCYEMDATSVHLYNDDIPIPTTNAVYRDFQGNQKNFMLQDLWRLLRDNGGPDYHNLETLYKETGIRDNIWTAETDDKVWEHFLDQFSVNEMMCRFYHCGFEIPSLVEYGIPVTYSADTPGQIGTNNKMMMGRTTAYCDTILGCTFNITLCEEFGYALGQEVAASGINGTSWFYGPGNNLHRSCLSGKNNNYFSQDAYLAGSICGWFLKGLQAGGVNGCMKHFACNDQELSREGLVVFSNEQALRELYFAAFEHALKISGGKGIMTSLGRVGTVNACGNTHLTVDLLRKEWGFDGMVITDGYGVTSYMYEINVMLGANSGLLCFGNSGNFGECKDYMELYRYYLQYPGRTTEALRRFMKGSLEGLMASHTFRDLYTDYDYYRSEDAGTTSDINWFDAQIGLGYEYNQAGSLTYKGIKLMPGECNPPGMMPNDNCKDRSGTIETDDYGLRILELNCKCGNELRIPVSVEKCYGMQEMGFSVCFDTKALEFICIDRTASILNPFNYYFETKAEETGVNVIISTSGNVFSTPCGELFTLVLKSKRPGVYPVRLMPLLNPDGTLSDSFMDKQGHEMSWTLTSQKERYHVSSGWSGTYQNVNGAEWQSTADGEIDTDLADITLLSNIITIKV